MRLFAAVLTGAFLAGSSFVLAQPGTEPEISTPQPTISLAVGQAQKLIFPTMFDRIDLTSNTIVEAKPLTDQVMTLHGIGAGETILTVLMGGQELYSATIIVSPEIGRIVKIYGTVKSDDSNAGHIAVFCNELGCGRPDKDMPQPTIAISRITHVTKDKSANRNPY